MIIAIEMSLLVLFGLAFGFFVMPLLVRGLALLLMELIELAWVIKAQFRLSLAKYRNWRLYRKGL